jgi:hypothetical protein
VRFELSFEHARLERAARRQEAETPERWVGDACRRHRLADQMQEGDVDRCVEPVVEMVGGHARHRQEVRTGADQRLGAGHQGG